MFFTVAVCLVCRVKFKIGFNFWGILKTISTFPIVKLFIAVKIIVLIIIGDKPQGCILMSNKSKVGHYKCECQ